MRIERMRNNQQRAVRSAAVTIALALSLAAGASLAAGGKLLATAGVSQVEGSGGGGLTPWATITGYGTRDEIGANAFYTHATTPNFSLDVVGASVGFFDRLELSVARQRFNTGLTGTALGLEADHDFRQDVFGAKLRLFGSVVYDQDRLLPQVSLGVQHKRNHESDLVAALGAEDDSGTDYYIAATKLFLGQSLLVNATVRATRANQMGLLGFGGDRNDSYEAQFETSVAWLLNRKTAVGVEYRSKPDNLGFAREDDWADVFVAYFPSRNLSLTAAYVDLGEIATVDNQRGPYLSIQAGF